MLAFIRNWGGKALVIINILSIFALLFYFGTRPLKAGDNIEYKDLITIILTAIAVLLAAVTIFVAAMAIWGYSSIREESVKAAIKAAETEAGKVATRVASSTGSRASLVTTDAIEEKAGGENYDELVSALQSRSRRISDSARSRRKMDEKSSANRSDGHDK